MTHEPRRDELLDLALGLLEPDQARALEAHAAGCAACRSELAALRRTRQLVADLPPPEAPSRGAAAVLAAAARAAEQARASRRPRWSAPRWLWGGTLGLVGAAAAAVLVLRVAPPPARPGDSEPEPVRVTEPSKGLATPARAGKGAVEARGDAADALASAPATSPPPGAAERKVTPAPLERPEAPAAAPVEPRAELAEASGAGGANQAAPAQPRAAALRAAPPAARAAAGAEEGPCRLEQRRRFTRDEAGQVVGRRREGRYPVAGGEAPLTVEERFGPDGRLLGATVRAGDRLLTVTGADVEAGRLEPLPGVVVARTAAEALQAPPRCEP